MRYEYPPGDWTYKPWPWDAINAKRKGSAMTHTEHSPEACAENLATMTKPCPKCGGSGDLVWAAEWEHEHPNKPVPACDACEDGTSLRFPGLSKPCPCISSVGFGSDGINHHYANGGCKPCWLRDGHVDDCNPCDGTGRVPDVTLEGLLACTISYSIGAGWDKSQGHGAFMSFEVIGETVGREHHGADSPLNAAIIATCKAFSHA